MIRSESTATTTTRSVESSAAPAAELTVVVVTWNTRQLTLRCLETLFDNTPDLRMRVIVADNNSEDGSADAIVRRFPQVDLIRNPGDFGFARANNEALRLVDSEWVLLLNPDTEVHQRAINHLLAFSKQHPDAGITGGRTVFPDGTLNRTSCFNKMTSWSLFCYLTGLSRLFSETTLFNPEGIGGWKRDSVRHVDIVCGAFLMIPTALWNRLGGFDPRYFMYGEEVDLCLRAAALGYRPMITPDAQIMHLGGASTPKPVRMLQNWKSRSTLIRQRWPKFAVPVGLLELWLCCATRSLASVVLGKLFGGNRTDGWTQMWAKRREWLKGY
jgi:N-acetylglucosaminyl-diphospho-decaprenol L-rhamnosyltransferase